MFSIHFQMSYSIKLINYLKLIFYCLFNKEQVDKSRENLGQNNRASQVYLMRGNEIQEN